MRTRIYTVEGNIGAGKSTTLSHLSKIGFHVIKEDLQEWGHLLGKFYENPTRWSFVLQISILESMCSQLENIKGGKDDHSVVIMERSPMSSYVFAYNSFKQGHMTLLQFETYREYFLKRVSSLPLLESIYLHLEYSECLKRVRSRSREGEKHISLEYLRDIEDAHKSVRESSWEIDCLGQTPTDVAEIICRYITQS